MLRANSVLPDTRAKSKTSDRDKTGGEGAERRRTALRNFVCLPERMNWDDRAANRHRRVLGAICKAVDTTNGYAVISQARIAELSGYTSRDYVSRAIRELEHLGYVEIIRRGRRRGGGFKANVYRVIYEADAVDPVDQAANEVRRAADRDDRHAHSGVDTDHAHSGVDTAMSTPGWTDSDPPPSDRSSSSDRHAGAAKKDPAASRSRAAQAELYGRPAREDGRRSKTAPSTRRTPEQDRTADRDTTREGQRVADAFDSRRKGEADQACNEAMTRLMQAHDPMRVMEVLEGVLPKAQELECAGHGRGVAYMDTIVANAFGTRGGAWHDA